MCIETAGTSAIPPSTPVRYLDIYFLHMVHSHVVSLHLHGTDAYPCILLAFTLMHGVDAFLS